MLFYIALAVVGPLLLIIISAYAAFVRKPYAKFAYFRPISSPLCTPELNGQTTTVCWLSKIGWSINEFSCLVWYTSDGSKSQQMA